MKRILTHTALVVGVALLVLAYALPAFVLPAGKVVPKDIDNYSATTPAEGELLDSAAMAAGKVVGDNTRRPECRGDSDKPVSCFIWHDIELKNQRHVVAQEPTSKKKVTLEAGGTLVRTDLPEPRNLVTASVDRTTLDRKTAMPVDEPVSSLDMTTPGAPASGGDRVGEETPQFTRTGLQYQFPFGTQKKAYPYFDQQVLRTQNIDFVDKEKIDGENVYRYEQVIHPTEQFPPVEQMLSSDGDLSDADRQTLASLKLTFPAKAWGLNADDVDGWDGQGDGPDVEMSRYYTVHRTLHVHPETGVIVKEEEETWMFFARDSDDASRIAADKDAELENPRRTALYYPAVSDDATVETRMSEAKSGALRMDVIGQYIPWGAGIIGVLLVGYAVVLIRRS
jgi:hypothetical protein